MDVRVEKLRLLLDRRFPQQQADRVYDVANSSLSMQTEQVEAAKRLTLLGNASAEMILEQEIKCVEAHIQSPGQFKAGCVQQKRSPN